MIFLELNYVYFNGEFVLSRLVFSSLDEVKELLTRELGSDVIVNNIKFDETVQELFVATTDVVSIDVLVELLLSEESTQMRIINPLFAPYDGGYLEILELTPYKK